MARTKAQKRAAKLRNRAKRKAPAQGKPRVRRDFFGKARSGDAAELRLTFSAESISVDPERPVASLGEALAERSCPEDDQAPSN